MDSSFTFVTALTPARGKIKAVSKIPKPNEKLKEPKFKIAKNASQTCQPSTSNALPRYNKVAADSSSSNSQKTNNDSIPSLKSCSDSLHLSSDHSLSDHKNENTSTVPFERSSLSDSQMAFKKLIHAGLERITFRKKRVQKSRGNENYNHYDNCLEQLTQIKITGSNEVKSSAPSEGCDNFVDLCDSVKLPSADLNDLPDKMLNLSLEKLKKPSTKSPSSINKKLFNSTINAGSQSDHIDNIDTPKQPSKNPAYPTDSSGIISEDISPILRFSVAPTTNVFVDSDDFPFPNNLQIDDKNLSCDRLEISNKINLEDKPTKKSKSVVKTTKVKDNKKKPRSVLSEVNNLEQKLNEDEKIKAEVKLDEKPKRTRVKKTTKKKKDSFVVSDTSSVDNDSMSVYHKFISENIRFDVIKTTTPRSKYKNNADLHDDGIFTPFIIKGKRSSSDDDFSEKENDNSEIRTRVKKTRWSSSEDENDVPKIKTSLIMSLSTLSDKYKFNKGSSSSDLEVSLKEEETVKKIKKTQPKKGVKKPTSRLNTSSGSAKFSTKSPDSDSGQELTSSPSFNIGSGTAGKKKATPITFKLKNLKKFTPIRTPNTRKEQLSFLRSLSTLTSPHMVHPEAAPYRKSFKKLKEELAKKLFTLFNKEVFDNKLPEDLKIEWNARMRSSSGLCYNRRIKTIIGPNNECLRVSRIALSTKIIETPERLRDTLIHEMCHAAAWIIDNKADGHGPCWKSWASKAQRRFPELPPIKRCHDYAVRTKFKYKCVNCGYTIGRHSKSLNLERKRCGYCYGRFELLLNQETSKGAGTGISPKNVKARPLSKFALFVKENYGKVKSENAAFKHAEVMKALSKNFADTKT